MIRLVLIIAALVGLAAFATRFLPPAWDPRTPLDLTATPNWLAAGKLAWMRQDPQACFAAFATSAIAVTRVPDRVSDTGCGTENALRLPTALRTMPNAPNLTCPLAAAWAMFERHTVQPAARLHLGQEVTGIRHLGAQTCRNIAGSTRRSEHATANAIDIAGFRLRDGREVTLAAGWTDEGADASFLRAVRDGACRWFQVVLGPDYDAAHRDHFHLDMGRFRACR
ncbi:MAG: extensin family protein [Pseudomonadota bacterium]